MSWDAVKKQYREKLKYFFKMSFNVRLYSVIMKWERYTQKLALPDNWEFSEKGLESILKDGMASIRSGLQDLEKFGYLKRIRSRDEKGRMANVEWIIFEKSTLPPGLGFPSVDNPNLENHIQYNTK